MMLCVAWNERVQGEEIIQLDWFGTLELNIGVSTVYPFMHPDGLV